MGMKRQRKLRRRVHFADEPVSCAKVIELVRDSWMSTKERNKSRRSDAQSVERDIHIQSYLRTTDASYVEVVNSKSRTIVCKGKLRQAMIHGVGKGYRGLEGSSRDAQQRKELGELSVVSILAMSRLLKSQGVASRDKQLRRHSKKLSLRSRQWAQFLGEVDATAAATEYATIPPSLLRVRLMVTTTAVVRQRSQQLPRGNRFLNRALQRWTSNEYEGTNDAVVYNVAPVPAVIAVGITV